MPEIFTPPNLRKRADGTPVYRFWCQKCDDEVAGYVIADIDNPPHCMSLNVYCHGDGIHIGISDVKSFREMMAPHEVKPGHPDPAPYKLFHPNDFKVDRGHTVDDFAPRRDSRDPVDGTEL